MKLAEELYTAGYLSYPRTETNQYPKETSFEQMIQTQIADRQLGAYAQKLVHDGFFQTPRVGRDTDNAHLPIHPTKSGAELSGDKRRLYELVARHFLATCSRDAQGSETVVQIRICEEEFTLKGWKITPL